MSRRFGFTMVEIMVAVLILAFALVPISHFLGSSGAESRKQHSEAEAIQFASDMMDEILMKRDFESLSSEPETTITFGKTSIKYTLDVVPVTLAQMGTINVPRIPFHSPCGEGTAAEGVETTNPTTLSSQISGQTHLTIEDLDMERLSQTTQQCELKDFRLVVKWKFTGADDREYERHPITLISRKARL